MTISVPNAVDRLDKLKINGLHRVTREQPHVRLRTGRNGAPLCRRVVAPFWNNYGEKTPTLAAVAVDDVAQPTMRAVAYSPHRQWPTSPALRITELSRAAEASKATDRQAPFPNQPRRRPTHKAADAWGHLA